MTRTLGRERERSDEEPIKGPELDDHRINASMNSDPSIGMRCLSIFLKGLSNTNPLDAIKQQLPSIHMGGISRMYDAAPKSISEQGAGASITR